MGFPMALNLVRSKMEEVNQAMAASGSASAAVSSGKAMAIAGLIGGVLMTAIVISFNPPKSEKETFVAVVSSLVCSLGGACALVLYFGMALPNNIYGLCLFLSLCFLCAGPGWFLVRLFFAQMRKIQRHGCRPDYRNYQRLV